MKTKVVLITAEKAPIAGIENPKPNQLYRCAKVLIEERELGVVDLNEIRVEMLYVGICGTDAHATTNNIETGYISSTAPLDIPDEGRVMGHEGVGRVLQVGSNVKNIKPGMYVTFESIIICNTCDVCRKGNFNQCRSAKLLGLETDGLMGTIVDVPYQVAHNITDYIKNENDLIAIACVEPAAVAYVACQNAQIKGGDVVVIFGAGPIGVFAAMLSKLVFGASDVNVNEKVSHLAMNF